MKSLKLLDMLDFFQNQMNREDDYVCGRNSLLLALLPIIYKMQLYRAFANRYIS